MKTLSKFIDLVAYRVFELQLYTEMYLKKIKAFFTKK